VVHIEAEHCRHDEDAAIPGGAPSIRSRSAAGCTILGQRFDLLTEEQPVRFRRREL
jgi:hypothetical protein